jgi:glycogen(starch) synthase
MIKTEFLQSINILATGESPYLSRHAFLFQTLSSHCKQLQILQRQNEWYEARIPRLLLKYLYTLRVFSKSKADTLFQKNQREFIAKSQRFEQEILQLGFAPDLVFHIFNTFSPSWNEYNVPYVLYLDYTMALSEQNKLSWAYFLNRTDRDGWMTCEQQLFQQAKHIFSQSQVVKNSLVKDYQISPDRIAVVGASGNFQEPYDGEKFFGSQQILFNGSDFHRKGGPLVLAAFKQVKQVLPDAKLVVIGKKMVMQQEGIENPGQVSPETLKELFLTSDLVLAPADCDPFPRFVMEAMNYGVPCIVSDRDGMPEIVDHSLNGIVIDKPTPSSLATTIVDLLSYPDRLEVMSQAAQHKIRTHLNWNNVVSQITSTLAEIHFC